MSNPKNFHKKISVLIRSIRAITSTLPSYSLLRKGSIQLKNSSGQQMALQGGLFHKQRTSSDLLENSNLSAYFQIMTQKQQAKYRFPQNIDKKKRKLFDLQNSFGQLSVDLEYISKADILASLKSDLNLIAKPILN